MDATTTPLTSWLIQTLKELHPDISFTKAEHFSWSPSKHTVFYNAALPNAEALLLHELAHALLDHRMYRRDVELVAMESDAWEKAQAYAKENAPQLRNLQLADEVIQDHLDTYREWLHNRSTCPNCSATGYQDGATTYTCPACSHRWRVNEARVCALRRYSI